MHQQHLLIIILLWWGYQICVVGKMYNLEPIRYSLTGDIMENITKCNNYLHEKLSPKEIHIMMMGSSFYLKDYSLQIESIKEYSDLHGYSFHTIDPGLVMEKFGSMPADYGGINTPHIVASKTLLIYYYMREFFHLHRCTAKWLLFLDADVVILDLTRSLESIIGHANELYFPSNKTKTDSIERTHGGCEVIAQLASTTINSGVIFVRISPKGEKFIRQWIQNHIQQRTHGSCWQDEQGWLQYTYLQHLEKLYNIKMPFDCSDRDIRKYKNVPENSIRSQCFASLMYVTGLLPTLGRHHLLYQPYKLSLLLNNDDNNNNNSSNNINNEDYQRESVGHSNHRMQHKNRGNDFCLLSGLSTEDRINLHDWATELSIPQDTSKSTSGEFLQTLNWEVNGVTQKGTCPIKGALLFHGRDEATLAYLQKNWKKNLERAKRVFSERHSLHNSTVKGNSGSDSLHLFECDHDSSSGGNNNIGLAGERKKCNHCEQDVMSLLGNAGPDINWMPNKMRANAERLLLRLKTML